MPLPLEKIIHTQPFQSKDSTIFTHTVTVVQIEGRGGRWIAKKIADEDDPPELEVLAQELFRLFNPHQPETLLAEQPQPEKPVSEQPQPETLLAEENKELYVLSKEIPDFDSLPKNTCKKIKEGQISGLGCVVVLALFVEEIDLKPGNVGINNEKKVVKIDGDWCFATCKINDQAENFIITPKVLDALPMPINESIFNWLDLKRTARNSKSSFIVDPTLTRDPIFRQEINSAVLQISILPDAFIDNFVGHYLGDTELKDALSTILKRHRDEFINSALQNQSFIDFLNSDKSIEAHRKMKAQVRAFRSRDQLIFSEAELARYLEDMTVKYRSLKNPLPPLIPSLLDTEKTTFIDKYMHLYGAISTYYKNTGEKDALVKTFLDETQYCHEAFKGQKIQETKILGNLQDAYNQLNSSEFQGKLEEISTLRNATGLFAERQSGAITRIEAELFSTPLEHRKTVKSHPYKIEVTKPPEQAQ